jgi:hypothetical protein
VAADRLDVSDDGVLSAPVARERRAAGDANNDVLGEVPKGPVPVATLRGGELVGHELTRRHGVESPAAVNLSLRCRGEARSAALVESDHAAVTAAAGCYFRTDSREAFFHHAVDRSPGPRPLALPPLPGAPRGPVSTSQAADIYACGRFRSSSLLSGRWHTYGRDCARGVGRLHQSKRESATWSEE